MLGTISAFAFRHRETKNGYINFRTRCLRLPASNKINQKKQKVQSEVWPNLLRCFWKNGNRSVILSRKTLTRFSLTNVKLYHNSHFANDSNCTATLFHINFALNDKFPTILMIKVWNVLILNSFSDFNTFLNKTQHSFYKHITVYHFPLILQTVAQVTWN